MEHVVFWSSPSGSHNHGQQHQRVPALAEAIELVQRLRNVEQVTDAEVHALTAVPLNFRTVVVVEPVVGDAAAAPAPVSAFASYDRDDEPTSDAVPGVAPDHGGPFRSLSAVSAPAFGPADGGPHLVGLPSVAAEPVLHVVPEPEPLDETPSVEVPEQADGLDPVPGLVDDAEPLVPMADPTPRSLGLFA